MSKPETSLGRRHLLSGAAALGIGALTATAVAGGASAEDAPPTGFGASGNEPSETDSTLHAEGIPLPEVLPTLVPGAKTKSISSWSMSTYGFASTTSASKRLNPGTPYDMTATDDAVRMVASLGIEPGSTVVRIDLYGSISGGPLSQAYYLAALGATDATLTTLDSGNTGSIPTGAWNRSFTTAFTTQVGLDYVVLFETTPTTKFASGVVVQYIPPSTTFVPITPYRAYDSRKAAVPNPGILGPNSNRVVNIVNAINDAGTIITANVIPSTARAVTYNITATLTTGDNFLAVAPGLAASTTVSAINFAANQTLANAATVSIDNGTVKVFCGGNVGSSHFIIDITGYYI